MANVETSHTPEETIAILGLADNIFAALANLESALSPILRPEEPQDKQNEAPREVHSEHYDSLSRCLNRIYSIMNRIDL